MSLNFGVPGIEEVLRTQGWEHVKRIQEPKGHSSERALKQNNLNNKVSIEIISLQPPNETNTCEIISI